MATTKRNVKDKKILLKFFGGILIGAIFGGFTSFIVMAQSQKIGIWAEVLNDFILKQSHYIMVILYVLLVGIALLFYVRAKHLFKTKGLDDDEVFDKIDWNLSVGLGIIGVSMPVVFLTYGLTVMNIQESTLGIIVFVLIFFIFSMFLLIFLQGKFVKFAKILYPNKQGNILDTKFHKEWMNSCDEAEKLMIYRASYETYKRMQFLYMGITLFLLFASLVINFSILPYMIVGILWIANLSIYSYQSTKISKQNLQD